MTFRTHVPKQIIKNRNVDIYERIMTSAKVPVAIIHHLKGMVNKLDSLFQDLNEKENPDVSFQLFQETALLRKFDDYGCPIV
jgi:hypothetical protein